MRIKISLISSGLLAVAALLVPAAHATLLAPGQCAAANATVVASDGCIGIYATTTGFPAFGGVVVADSGLKWSPTVVGGETLYVSNPAGSANIQAEVATTVNFRTEVVKEAGGTMDFYYQFKDVSSLLNPNDFVKQMTMSDFTGFTTDVYVDTSANLVGDNGADAPRKISSAKLLTCWQTARSCRAPRFFCASCASGTIT